MSQIYTPCNATDMNNGFLGLFRCVNTNGTEGMFMAMILGIIWIIVFANIKAYSTSRAFTYANIVCFVLSMPLAVLNLINPRYTYILALLMGIGVVWLKLEAR
jgi:predicted benzoate:H+ symporter BenE